MIKITTSELKTTTAYCRKANKPLLILGTYGIGKSEMIFQDAQEEASRMERQFLDWNRSSISDKQDAMMHPEKYYMFVDIRISQLDDGDLRGIPVVGNIDAAKDNELKLVTLGWINYITKPNAAGTVFFDELNLARPSVTASAYSIINDRVISDRAISKDVFIVAAGNNEDDCDLVQPIAEPLLDRFAAAQLILDKKYWLDWAATNINPYLYAFCCWDKDMIHKPAKPGQDDKAITPRGIYNASCILNNVDFENKKEVNMSIALCVGEAFATKFLAYYEHVRAIDWAKLEADPSVVENYDTEKQYAIMGAAVSGIKEVAERQNTSVADFFDNCFRELQVLTYLPSDFVMASIKQFVNITPNYETKKRSLECNLSVANLITKLFLCGIKDFENAKKISKTQFDKIEKIEKRFKQKHAKIFSRL